MTRILLALSAAVAVLLTSSSRADDLADAFVSPPDVAKPRTWWHWTNGNVSKDGITKDLEWMKRVGIGDVCPPPAATSANCIHPFPPRQD